MRIGIDIRYLSHGLVGGVHRYIAQMVPALLEAGPEHQFFLYADTKAPLELENLPANATVRLLDYRNGLSSIYLDLFMKQAMAQDKLDVVHFPANYGFGPAGARTVITLHDQINIMPLREIIRGHRKSVKTIGMMSYLHFSSLAALRSASLILTVSQYSKDRILEHANFPADRIIPLFYGPSPKVRVIENKALLENVRDRLGLQKPFVLADGVKNPATLTKAWQLLPPALRDTHQMVFFSRRPDPPSEVLEAVERGQAVLLVRPSDDDLVALFNLARAFVFPSWIEGFGIPLVEAMTCGTPIIASDRGSIPEVVGDAALIADAEDAPAFARHIERVLTDPAAADDLRQRGLKRSVIFRWDNTARQILDVYQQALLPLR
jgi:glycosyltransferase involved in cell wall biosynthesis